MKSLLGIFSSPAERADSGCSRRSWLERVQVLGRGSHPSNVKKRQLLKLVQGLCTASESSYQGTASSLGANPWQSF